MEEQSKKSLLEQKLSDPSTSLESLLTHDSFVEMFRVGNPLLLNFLKLQHYRKLVAYLTVVGPEQDQLRSFQFPQLACDIFMCTQCPKVAQILFQSEGQPKSELIYSILDYFKSAPNYVLSGYVIKVIGNLYFLHPFKIQEYLLKGPYASLMLKYLQSKSVAQFLIRLIAVEDQTLLNSMLDHRRRLLNQVVSLYTDKETDTEIKAQVCFMLTDILTRLWTNKHKESGLFSREIFKIVEVALNQEYATFADHQNLVSVVMKNLTNHVDVAPFLIKKMTKKILKELSSFQVTVVAGSHRKQVPKFTQRNLKFLLGLTHVMKHLSAIQEVLKNHNIFGVLLGMMEQFQWNNIVHVQVEKIFKVALASQSESMYSLVFKKGDFATKVIEMIQDQKQSKTFGKGYTGCLTNILLALTEAAKKDTPLGKSVKKLNAGFLRLVGTYLEPKLGQFKIDLAGYKTNSEYAPPEYHEDQLLQRHRLFLDKHPNTSALTSSIQTKEVLEEIQDQNQVNQHLVEEEKRQQPKQEEITISAQTPG